MPSREVSRRELDLQDNREVLSPPIVAEPLYQCAVAVTVLAFVPHAELELEVGGTVVATVMAGFPLPDGETIALSSPLVAGQVVRARQRTSSAVSPWSAPVTVRDHTEDYPAGPPRPQINPAPVYACGSRTGVSNLLIGGTVWITADGAEVGKVEGCKEHQGVNITPDYGLGQVVRAWFELCSDQSPPSVAYDAGSPPSPLPEPIVETVYEGGEQIRIVNVVNGARFDVFRDGVNQGTWRTWGGAHLVGLAPPLSAGEVLQVSQRMCPGDPEGTGDPTEVEPCSALPAPEVYPIQLGDQHVLVTDYEPGATVKVYVNMVKVGEGGGPLVLLARPIEHGDVVHVEQVLGSCQGQIVTEVTPVCVAPQVTGDPSAQDLFPVGFLDYEEGEVRGSVYYPAQDDGEGQPFNERLAELGRVPIVFVAHGNHATRHNPSNREEEACSAPETWPTIPNYKGYRYFQAALAKTGIIAVSVDCNVTNCVGLSVANIEARADLIIGSIDYFKTLDSTSGSTFENRIDLNRVGLMGHSRGGEAVVLVPEVISLAGVNIRSVISLAPTDVGASSGQPAGYAFMTILPAGDRDVRSNDGAKFYDQAKPTPFRSQLYVHEANHNFFNREWVLDDGQYVGALAGYSKPPRTGPLMTRYQHERVLDVYGCAFFRATLQGHRSMLAFLSGHGLPGGVRTDNVKWSFEWEELLTVDNHEENNGIGTNSLSGATSQTGLSADEFAFRQSSLMGLAPFNGTFFGKSLGMAVESEEPGAVFRSELPDPVDITEAEIWLRGAEVYTGSLPSDGTGFELGLEDVNGTTVWVDSDDVGGLYRPFDRRADDMAAYGFDITKTMLSTMRFPGGCFQARGERFEPQGIRAILIRCSREDRQPMAFDDLQVLERVW
jgi:dienelactone hydrolase